MYDLHDFGWAQTDRQHEKAYKQLDEFFEYLHAKSINDSQDIGITYRESQQRFASTVMEAIKEKRILLIQAGVGTGKSFGYLIPVFYTWDNVTSFDKIIISTSSMALQDQLIKDIDYISELLGITIKRCSVKGINNYACIRQIEKKFVTATQHHDQKTADMILEIKKAMKKSGECDKTKLPNIPNNLWQELRVRGGCEHCNFRADCAFTDMQMRSLNSAIVVTNHTQFSNMIKNDDPSLTGASLVVIDEAHNLEEQMRLANQGVLNLVGIYDKMREFQFILERDDKHDFSYEIIEFITLGYSIKAKLKKLAIAIRSNARYVFRTNGNSERMPIVDCDKLNFNSENKHVKIALEELNIELDKLQELLSALPYIYNSEKTINSLRSIISIFRDMAMGKDSKNLYWTRYIDKDKVEIVYTIKDLTDFFDKMMGSQKAVVFTSATITTNGEYDHLINSLGLQDNDRVNYEFPIASPFDYDSNSLFYYDETLPNPNDLDREKYIKEIALKIIELIETTCGKALILFTSKSDMNAVYDIIQSTDLQYKLILQEDSDVTKCKEEFMNNENSCLFASGAFWEGMDFPGKTLSNLIVVRLPFPVQDPIVEYKKSLLNKSEKSQVDINEMLLKLSQGTGRLIRSVNDTGIVCCLDSRTPKYLEEIKKSLPFTRYTNDIDEVTAFAQDKIITSNEPEKKLTFNPIENK